MKFEHASKPARLTGSTLYMIKLLILDAPMLSRLKKIKLKQIQDQFTVEKILLTPELIEDRELEIRDFASEIVSLQEKRFGPNGDMIIQKNQLIKPVQDQVLSIVGVFSKSNRSRGHRHHHH